MDQRHLARRRKVVAALAAFAPAAMTDALTALGCDVRQNRYQARVQAIGIDADGALTAGADPRGGAVARA